MCYPKAIAAVFGVLLFSAASFAQPKIIGDTTLPANTFALLKLDSKAAVSWKVVPTPTRKAILDKHLIFSGKPGVVYTVYATVIDFDAKTFDEAEVQVTFGDDPGPSPPPPVPPPPPAPSGLVKELKDAAIADGWVKTKLVDMADWLLACSDLAVKGGTIGEFKTSIQNAQRSAIGPLPASIKALMQREFKALETIVSSADDSATLTATQRVDAQTFFKRLAKAAEDAAK